MSEKRQAVKVYLTADENQHLIRQAQALGMERGQLIRLRALGDPATGSKAPAAPLTLRDYQRAVQAALAASRGCAPRPIIETITAAVITAIHKPHDKPQNPVPDTAGAAHTDG